MTKTITLTEHDYHTLLACVFSLQQCVVQAHGKQAVVATQNLHAALAVRPIPSETVLCRDSQKQDNFV